MSWIDSFASGHSDADELVFRWQGERQFRIRERGSNKLMLCASRSAYCARLDSPVLLRPCALGSRKRQVIGPLVGTLSLRRHSPQERAPTKARQAREQQRQDRLSCRFRLLLTCDRVRQTSIVLATASSQVICLVTHNETPLTEGSSQDTDETTI